MHAIFIAFDQAHYEAVVELLDRNGCRGFTSLGDTPGRGSVKGEPHYGSHAWPSMGSSILTIIEDRKLDPVLKALRALDESKPLLGLRAFVWPITQTI